MAKHVKILEGHSINEWESKFKKKIEKGKLRTFNSEKELIDFATYWKINNKYYQVPTFFEWYNKSLRKSVGLTVALTATSVLATFFLCAALIQSQIKWNEDQGYTVSLYADEGAFKDGSKTVKTKTISGIKKGTKLKDVKGYDSCIPIRDDYEFKHWHVDDGEEIPTEFSDDMEITSNVSLKAYYELNPRSPDKFDEDSWETVLSVIRQGKAVFIDTYCKDQPSYSTDKEKALLEFMDSPTNWRIISVGNVGDYGVRIIGIGQDKLYSTEESLDRELFTFEFNECIFPISYSFAEYGTPFYTKSGSSDPYEIQEYCGLKTYTEDIVLNQLPLLIRENMKTVTKRTLQVKGGFKYHYNETLQSWVFDRECLDGSADEDNKLEIVNTPERLFSLSLDEIGATKYQFKYGDKEEGLKLMGETTQHNKELMDKVGLKVGEGFYDEETEDYTGAYPFYTHEWYNPDDHTDDIKRMKRYFIGTGEKSVNALYRLRSIYIPNEYDADEDNRASGNKDYSPFETWNISAEGTIGNRKTSGRINHDVEPNDRYHFAAGDMAWNSAFVAPAFCL
ncbi:MAG: hypothetical protein MJ213_02060 [Bacilli bacterium]|nr:hypothetical protein [Bacilli bacterium]